MKTFNILYFPIDHFTRYKQLLHIISSFILFFILSINIFEDFFKEKNIQK